MRDSFQSNKHDFRPNRYGDNDDGIFKIEIPGLRSDLDDPKLQVAGPGEPQVAGPDEPQVAGLSELQVAGLDMVFQG